MEILLLVILIALSGFFSSAEIAFFSLSDIEMKMLSTGKGKNLKKVLKLKKKPQKLLITILVGNNIVNILSASIATVIAIEWFGSFGVGIATGVITLLILVFGEIAPKSFAQENNQKIVLLAAPFLYFLFIIFSPIVFLLEKFNQGIMRLFGNKETKIVETKEKIYVLARMGVEDGHMNYKEKEMIENVLEFNSVTVEDVMTPRYRMVAVRGEVPVEQIAYPLTRDGFSRYPVYLDNEDNFIGYIHSSDIMKYLNSDQREIAVKDIVRDVVFVDKGDKVEAVFRKMIRKREHLFLVRDHEEVVGLVCLEDILEEIVGEIVDETDEVSHAKHGLSRKKNNNIEKINDEL
jgi:putative hemolysin